MQESLQHRKKRKRRTGTSIGESCGALGPGRTPDQKAFRPSFFFVCFLQLFSEFGAPLLLTKMLQTAIRGFSPVHALGGFHNYPLSWKHKTPGKTNEHALFESKLLLARIVVFGAQRRRSSASKILAILCLCHKT